MAEAASETSQASSQVTAIGLEVKSTGGMKYRRVGKSGLTVSEMGVGCFSFGDFVDVKAAAAVVHSALGLGINYFDTADSYGIGVSEEKLGAALAGRRDKAVIATKFSNRMDHGPNDFGTSRLHIVRACEASLRRLKTDYIDLYQIHWPDRRTPIEETLRALDDLVRAGKVRYLGVANFFEWEICEAQWTAEKYNLQKFISAQDHYSLLYRDIEKRMEPFCVKYGIGMNSYFPLAGGLLTGMYKRDVAATPAPVPPRARIMRRGTASETGMFRRISRRSRNRGDGRFRRCPWRGFCRGRRCQRSSPERTSPSTSPRISRRWKSSSRPTISSKSTA
jgi:aryl-alcohol dehydrogenase-like predicted oxidoreductase